MGEYEDMVRRAIERKYGSIPKMAYETGIARNTIYHALERGLDNTTTKTRNAILEPLFGVGGIEYYHVKVDEAPADEAELLDIYRSLDANGKSVLLATARALAGAR